MACKTISSTNNQPPRLSPQPPMTTFKSSARERCGGMTLPETMVALGIGSIVLAVLASFSFHSGRSLAAMGNYVDLDNTSRKAVDLITREIRQTASLTDYQTNILTFADYDGTQRQYIYNPTERTLVRVK